MATKETTTIRVIHYYLAQVLSEKGSKVLSIKPEVGQDNERGYNTIEFIIERDKDGDQRLNLHNDRLPKRSNTASP